jgi:hypothetical protein
MRPVVDPQKLFNWAAKRQGAAPGEEAKLKQAAAHFGVPMTSIEDAVEAYNGDGYLGIATAVRVGTGYYKLHRNAHIIEAYK